MPPLLMVEGRVPHPTQMAEAVKREAGRHRCRGGPEPKGANGVESTGYTQQDQAAGAKTGEPASAGRNEGQACPLEASRRAGPRVDPLRLVRVVPVQR